MTNQTFVIKYSNTSAETINEHQTILRNNTKVFWGWWKKFDEYDQFSELSALKAKTPFKIGIINKEDGEYYIANCVNIYLGNTAKDLIDSPEIKYTPTYYNQKKCPAWFELTTLEKIEISTFNSYFHKIPYGDQTLFTVSERKINESEIDKVEVAKFSTIKGNSILHISDIHFGKDHNYKDTINQLKEKKLFDVIKPILEKYKNDIGVVVASGDFISRANTGQTHDSFNDAQIFLRQLLRYLELDIQKLILIPGNHDMPLIENEEDPLKDGNYTSQFRKFREEIKRIPQHKEIEFWAGFKTPNEWNIIFSYFNSAEYKFQYLSNFGYIDKTKYEIIFKNLTNSIGTSDQIEFIKKRILNFCVIHHHLKMFMPTQEIAKPDPAKKESASQSVSVLLNAGKFETDAINAGMHFLLHGHQHLPYVGSTGHIENGMRKNLNILSAGSAGSVLTKGYINQAPYNSFSIYTPQHDKLKVTIEKYNDDLETPNPPAMIIEVPYL